jgi:Trypsin-co-occurring domain 1
MAELLEYELSQGGSVVVEVGEPDRLGRAGREQTVAKAAITLHEALAPAMKAASEILEGFRALAQRPDEVEVKFGVGMDGKVGGVIVSAGASVQFEVTLRWKEKERAPESAPTPTPTPEKEQTPESAPTPDPA